MKKIVSVFCIFTFIFSAICAKPKYISPNNDGVQDELEIPLQISDKRYVQGWSLVIMNEQKEVVRVIENKVSLPEKIGTIPIVQFDSPESLEQGHNNKMVIM